MNQSPSAISPITCNQKALALNKIPEIYGSFSEIGAGQETVRYFFRVGGASKTVVRALSAYDKAFSDAIYGKEEDGRYVTKSRLKKMLQYEWGLLKERLIGNPDYQNKTFFAFANTLATVNAYKHTQNEGHGWIGLNFQTHPDSAPNEILLHIQLHDKDNKQQQHIVGTIGVNLIYAAFFYARDTPAFIRSLYDNLSTDRFSIQVLNFSGPDFTHIDNRLISLFIVNNNYAPCVCFGPNAQNTLLSDLVYKKNIFILRGSYRPINRIHIEIAEKGWQYFSRTNAIDPHNGITFFELSLNNPREFHHINEKDFLDRAELLCSLGKYVLITKFPTVQETILYLSSRCTTATIALGMGLPFFKAFFTEDFYEHLPGGILQSIGMLRQLKTPIFVYPGKNSPEDRVTFAEDLKEHPELAPYFPLLAPQIHSIKEYKDELLSIQAKDIADKIKNNDLEWHQMVPPEIIPHILKKQLFL